MPLKPEVNTSPFGALLLVAVLVVILAGALVLPALIHILAWGLVVLLVAMLVYYLGQRIHRRMLGRARQ